MGTIARIRLKESQLQTKSILSPTSKEFKFNKIAPKHNLIYKVLQEAAKIRLWINKHSESIVNLDNAGTEIISLLGKKEALTFATTDRMNLFTLEQLTDSTRKTLLTWKQIKHVRACKKKGRIPGWFSKLEQKVLKQNSNRELLD